VRVGGVHGGGERGEEGVEDGQRDANRVREHRRQSGRHGRGKRAHGELVTTAGGHWPRPWRYEAVRIFWLGWAKSRPRVAGNGNGGKKRPLFL